MTVVIQRPLRGSRISTFYPVKTLPSLSSLDSAFQLQEYISLLIRLDVHDVDLIVSIPEKNASTEKEKSVDTSGGDGGKSAEEGSSKDSDKERKSGEFAVDEACWIYEQLRRLAQDLSHPLITMLQQECTRATCPEMKAGEWLYLCVAHGNDGTMEQCCAIDYILHTLDSATALLNSPRTFPSRLSIPQTSHRHFSALARRLGRVFAHAYFHHREAFEQAEAESSLYARFLALTSKFDLVPAEFLVIPSRLDGEDDGRRGSPPRLLAASIDRRGLQSQEAPFDVNALSVPGWEQGKDSNRNPPGLAGDAVDSARRSESPRKFGRNRTDTMVFSEAHFVAEELAKADDGEAAAAAVVPLPDAFGEPGAAAPGEVAASVGPPAPEDIEDTLGTPDTGAVLESAIPHADAFTGPMTIDLTSASHTEALESSNEVYSVPSASELVPAESPASDGEASLEAKESVHVPEVHSDPSEVPPAEVAAANDEQSTVSTEAKAEVAPIAKEDEQTEHVDVATAPAVELPSEEAPNEPASVEQSPAEADETAESPQPQAEPQPAESEVIEVALDEAAPAKIPTAEPSEAQVVSGAEEGSAELAELAEPAAEGAEA